MPTDLHPALVGLEPVELWRQFDALRRIPRPSLHEEGVRSHLREIAAREGWACETDDGGNLVLRVPGRGKGVASETLAIQGHMDMVCEKTESSAHDFYQDPIELRRATRTIGGREREVIEAHDTTLGSDNGIGIAAALAVASSPEFDHPPLELLFTADEEQGMSGAFNLDPKLLSARRMINLDAEAQGRIYLSCAGGRELHASWDLYRASDHRGDVPVRITVRGLRGGHSGVDIHEGRANAIAGLVEILTDKQVDLEGVRLASCDGGGRPNAIALLAETVLWVARNRVRGLCEAIEQAGRRYETRYESIDPDIVVCFEELDPADHDEVPAPVSAMTSRAILEALRNQPHGVLTWSSVIPDLVETSNNIGSIETDGDIMRLVMMTRSSKAGATEHFQERCERYLEASGAEVEYKYAFPGWEAKVDTQLLATAEASYRGLFGEAPKREAIHAGLECGILGDRIPGIEMISFGPDIFDAHTPRESLAIDTVEPFWRFVVRLVADLV